MHPIKVLIVGAGPWRVSECERLGAQFRYICYAGKENEFIDKDVDYAHRAGITGVVVELWGK